MKRFLYRLEANFEPFMMMTLFYSLLTLLIVQITLRKFAGGGLPWAEEISRFMFVWLMYFGISYATRNQRHIKVRYFIQLFKEKTQKYFAIAADLFFLLFTVVVFISVTGLVQDIAKFGDKAISANISMNFLYFAGLVGLVLITIRVIQSIIWKIMNLNQPMERFENVMGTYYNDSHLLDLFKADNNDDTKSNEDISQKGGGCNQ
ncbi:TRAP transporter small permease [Desulfitibacter alkalitolerans]|uniref:TRAP transporter small permease n=1 Tax=Desulfitibacter alkalitolerans TaxID=264641 RepID=UPI00047FEBA5|nr:TRAP transporter small permease [Desulfitibacter alkalitolerans]